MKAMNNPQPTYRFGLMLISIMCVLFCGCNNSKYLAENEALYVGAKVRFDANHTIEKESDLREDIDEVIKPEPNRKIFGMRPALWIHNQVKEPEKDKGLKFWLKYKLGKPPVLMSDVRPESVSRLIENRLYNHGYFNCSVNYEVDSTGHKKARMIYTATIDRPYRMDTILFENEDSTLLGKEIIRTQDETLLKTGDRYNLETFQEERNRIDKALKDSGYYYFNTDHLYITADTTIGNKTMNVFLAPSSNIPPEAALVYYLRNIRVYTNYQLGEEDQTPAGYDSTTFNQIEFYSDTALNYFRPKPLERAIFLEIGEKYSRERHELSLNRLMGLGAFKFADIRFSQAGDSLSGLLDAEIYLTPMDKKNIRAELEMVSKSNNFTGPRLTASWLNRNIFGGAELLKIDLSGGVETQIGGISEGSSSGDYFSYQLGVGAELQVPRFLTPFRIRYNSRFVPKTNIRARYELVKRVQYFQLNSVTTSFGYTWKPNQSIQHELNPVAITFSQLTQTTPEFEQLMDENPFLENSFAEQFILGPEYTFTYNDQENEDLRNHIYFIGGADVSNPGGVLGEVFSTYSRFTSDFRYYFKLNKSSKLASRIYAGIGIPYAHSQQLPYVKQFFSGGPNGVRAFRARTLGPGTYKIDDEDVATGFLDQNGDLKLEFSLEYRFDIYGFLKGAVFADAGNIWLTNENPGQPGAEFNQHTFMKELAVGGGVGLRMDFSFFVLRLDLAVPLRKPYLPEGERWVKDIRKERPVLNIAIGYPF